MRSSCRSFFRSDCFYQPLTNLIKDMRDLENAVVSRCQYMNERKLFFSVIPGKQQNYSRRDDCTFITSIVNWISENQNVYLEHYRDLDSYLKSFGSDWSKYDFSTYFKEIIFGAVLLTLVEITQSYTGAYWGRCNEATVKERCALAHVLFGKLSIAQLEDIDPMPFQMFLRAFGRFISAIDAGHLTKPSLPRIQWHPSYGNDVLQAQIKAILNIFDQAPMGKPIAASLFDGSYLKALASPRRGAPAPIEEPLMSELEDGFVCLSLRDSSPGSSASSALSDRVSVPASRSTQTESCVARENVKGSGSDSDFVQDDVVVMQMQSK